MLSLVNKGLALYQKDQQFGPAEECCAEALSIDPECDAAVATLAQLSMQQGRVDKAVEVGILISSNDPFFSLSITF